MRRRALAVGLGDVGLVGRVARLAGQRVGGGVAAGTHLGEHALGARRRAGGVRLARLEADDLEPVVEGQHMRQIAQTRAQIDHGARRRVGTHARDARRQPQTLVPLLRPHVARVRHLLQEPSIDGRIFHNFVR